MSNPWMLLYRGGVACAVAGALVFGLALKRIEPIPVVRAPSAFDAGRAHRWMWDLSKKFPNRVTWAEPRRQAASWLKGELRGMGYEPFGMEFSEIINGKEFTGLENVYAVKQGSSKADEILLTLAHYDITDTTVEGAMDDASGVGVVLELARVFAREKTERTMVFLLTDSEEFGAFWGARIFAKRFEGASRIKGALSFDFVAPGEQTGILTLCDGLKKGFAPLWLRQVAMDSIRSMGTVEATDLTGIIEFAERAVHLPPSDHGALVAAGIPAVNWVGQTRDFPRVMAKIHHTREDVAEKLNVQAMSDFGIAAETAFRTMDALPAIPESFEYFKVSQHTYLPGWAIRLIQALAFAPLIVFSAAKAWTTLRRRSRTRIRQVAANELKSLAITLSALLVGYVVILLLPVAKVITQYEDFPATQKSRILYNPNFAAIFLVILAVALAYWALRRAFRERDDSVGYAEIRHAIHAGVLSLLAFAGLIGNGYLAVVLLLVPGYLWIALRASRTFESRALNFLMILGGSITFVIVAVVLSQIFHIGVVYWYVFLSVAYGLFSAQAVVLVLVGVAVMLRLIRSFVL